MKKVILLLALAMLVLALAACGSKVEKVTLKAGTPAYLLAKDLAAVIPALDPGKDTVLAKTRDFEVTAGEVVQVLQNNFGSRASQLKQADAAQLKEIFNRAAEQVAERKLLLAAAVKAGVKAAPEELTKVLEAQYAQAGGEQAFMEALNNEGISLDYVKNNIQESLTIENHLKTALTGKDAVSDEEIARVYGEDKTASVRHILLLTREKTDDEKAEIRKKMEGILARARAGEDFAGLAKEFSEDPGSKENGGLYENFGRGEMVKPFEDASFSVPVGQVSDIVETTYGYHIIKVEGRSKESRSLEEVRAEIESSLKDRKMRGATDEYLKGLKEKSGFKTFSL